MIKKIKTINCKVGTAINREITHPCDGCCDKTVVFSF